MELQVKVLLDYINTPSQHQDDQSCNKAIEALFSLTKNKTSLQLQYDGSPLCSYCAKQIYANQLYLQLGCSHNVHQTCFKILAKRIDFDTTQAQTMKCPSQPQCRAFDIKIEYFYQVYGREKMIKYQEYLTKEAMRNIEKADRDQRSQELRLMTFECVICVEDKNLEDEGCTLDCNHIYCRDCIKNMIEQLIKDGRFQESEIACSQCQVPINPNILRATISEHLFTRLSDLRYLNLQNSNPDIKYLRCPGMIRFKPDGTVETAGHNQTLIPSSAPQQPAAQQQAGQQQAEQPANQAAIQECVCIMEVDMKHFKVVTCGACKLEFCVHGCSATHKETTCEQFRQWQRENNQADAQFELLVKKEKMMSCPGCKRWIARNGGCRHMTCQKPGGCGHEFCFICGSNWKNKPQCTCKDGGGVGLGLFGFLGQQRR